MNNKFKNIFFILSFCIVFVSSCKMENHKKAHYTKKYSVLLASDVAIGYTCKTALALGTPVCMGADVIADLGIVTYYNLKYNKNKEEEAKITKKPFKRKTFNWKESTLDFTVFLGVLLLIP